MDAAVCFIEDTEIRESAADINSNPVAHGIDCRAVTPMVKTPCTRNCRIERLTRSDSLEDSAFAEEK